MNVIPFKTLGIQFEQHYLGGGPKKKTFIYKQQSERFLLPIGTHLLTGCVEETFYGTLNAGFLLYTT